MDKLKGLKGLKGSRKAQDKVEQLPKLKQEKGREEDRAGYIRRAVNDDRLAKQLVKLQEEYPAATLPELIAIHWLLKRNLKFVYQLNVRGGRVRAGGIIPDLVVFTDPYAVVWMIQGNYWHSRTEQLDQDARARLLLVGQTIEGRKVSAVVECWEDAIIRRPDAVFEAALLGQGAGKT